MEQAIDGRPGHRPHELVTAWRCGGTVDPYAPSLDYGAGATAEFQRLRDAKIRIGTLDLKTLDLKIAFITLGNNATLLTRNINDFGKVPSLRAEDRSA